MGWFFNKKNNSDQKAQEGGYSQDNSKKPVYQSKSYSYSKSKKCETDPENPEYIICKSVIKDENGTRQEQERIPANSQLNQFSNESFSSSFSLFPSLFRSNFANPENISQHFNQNQALHKNYSNDHSQNNEVRTFINSYSTNRQCHSDPQDNQFLICKSIIFDGKQQKEVQERVKASDMNFFNFGNLNFGSQLGNFGHNLDGEIQNFMKDLNSSIFPFFGPMMGFNFNNFGPFPHGQPNFPTTHNSSTQTPNENNGQKYNQQHPTQFSHHYFSMNDQKKSQTRDL